MTDKNKAYFYLETGWKNPPRKASCLLNKGGTYNWRYFLEYCNDFTTSNGSYFNLKSIKLGSNIESVLLYNSRNNTGNPIKITTDISDTTNMDLSKIRSITVVGKTTENFINDLSNRDNTKYYILILLIIYFYYIFKK
jgi:hypothetical protein